MAGSKRVLPIHISPWDLPSVRQFENACGSGEYCTASGGLNHQEAIYDVDGPADVGSTPANPRGVQDLTGNVLEWTRDEGKYDSKIVIGGSWDIIHIYDWYLSVDNRFGLNPNLPRYDVGFRCVAPPQDSKK